MKHISAITSSVVEVKEKWAVWPITTDSGKLIWGRKYIRVQKVYSGLAGEMPIPIWTELYTPKEWTLEQIRNPNINSNRRGRRGPRPGY
jgi:hypothetical protein